MILTPHPCPMDTGLQGYRLEIFLNGLSMSEPSSDLFARQDNMVAPILLFAAKMTFKIQ